MVLFWVTPHGWLVSTPTVLIILLAVQSPVGPASSIQRLGNQDLEWEKTNQLNIGVDIGFLANKITLSTEYYQRKTDNLILNVPLPPSFGYISSTVAQNVGSMKNDGFEMQLGYNKREGEFKWNVGANVDIVTNQVYNGRRG